MEVREIARVCHEVNRGYCQALGDDSHPSWEDAPGWQKESIIQGVHNILNFPNTTPEESHESWLAEKEADGWKYGEKKDPAAKTHPCFVPYGDLPLDQRAKDYIFGAVVRSLR